MRFVSDSLRNHLIERAEVVDRSFEWPADTWRQLNEDGLLGSSIPLIFGGRELGLVDRLVVMEEIAASCLTTALIYSQREAAIRQLLKGPFHLQETYLTALATGTIFMTVGLSHLTTSRQHAGPALRASLLPSGCYQLDGEIPWVTGADQAAAIVTGATLPDATQLMAVLPTNLEGVKIEPPLSLSALDGSRTSLIHCKSVILNPESVLIRPTDNLMGQIGGGGLDTSCLAIGMSTAATGYIQQEAQVRQNLVPIAAKFDESINKARQTLHELSTKQGEPERVLSLRVQTTKLAVRSTQAALMVAKGIGFVTPQPAQRWARQALFFLVWSCPRPVVDELLTDLAST